MAPIIEQLTGAAAAFALVFLAGYASARLLLPVAMHHWFWVAVPLTGLATAAVALAWLSILLPLSVGAWLFLAVVVAADAYLLLRRKLPPRDQAWREQGTVAALMALSFCLGLAPLWNRPELLAIGPNWDIEIYLPLAEYLKSHAIGFSLVDPAGYPFPDRPNPLLWRVNFFDVRWAGLAFSHLHAAVGAITGQEAHQHLSGLLALCQALSVPAAFLFVRIGLGLGRTPSLLAVAALSVSAAGLYVAYWNFGQQAISLALLPFALLSALMALPAGQAEAPTEEAGRRRPSGQAVGLAGLGLAALMAAFLPVLLLYALPVGILFLGSWLFSSRRRPVLWAGLSLVGISLLLAPWAYLRALFRAYHLFREGGVSGLTLGPDVTQFPPLEWAFGLFAGSGFAGLLTPASPNRADEAMLSLWTSFILVCLMGAGVVSALRRKEAALVVCGLAPAVLLLMLRYVTPYPYGYLKLLPSSAFLLVGLLVAGGWALWRMDLPSRRSRLALRAGLAGGGALFFGLNLASTAGLFADVRTQSGMGYRDFGALAELVPPGTSVLVSGHREYQGPQAGALAYFLRHTELYGYVQTGFSTFYRHKADGVYDYAVFHEQESPQPEIYPEGGIVWEGLGVRVYRGPERVGYYSDLGLASTPPLIERSAGQGAASGLRFTHWRDDGYPDFAGWSPPLVGVLAETVPPQTHYPEVAHGRALEVALSGDAPASSADREQELVVTLAAFHAQEIALSVDGRLRPLTVTPGLASYSVGQVTLPARLTIRNEGTTPVYVKSVLVRDDAAVGASYARFSDAVLVRWNSRQAGAAIRFTLDYLGPQCQPVLDVYSLDGRQHYGYWSLPALEASPPPGRLEGVRSYEARLDTIEQALYLGGPGSETLLAGWSGEAQDGDYRANLFLWRGDQVARSVPLFEFALGAARVGEPASQPTALYIG